MTEEERYQKLANEKQIALDNSNKTYEDLLKQNTTYSNSVNDYLKNYQNIQNQQLDKQTQFQVDLQNQNKEQAEKEFQKEATASKNAYYDFINPYGVQAEIQAQNGLNKSGYSETTKSQAWTTQQNRTAQAKANLNQAKLQFDNAIKEAYLNNDTQKAQLALEILQQQQQEALRSFNYTSDTKLNQLNNGQNLDTEYNNRYNTLYNQIQQEKATEEAIRQFNEELAMKQSQYEQDLAFKKAQYEQNLALQREQFEYQKQQDALANQLAQQQLSARYYSGGGSSSSSNYSNGYDLADNSTNTSNTPTKSAASALVNLAANTMKGITNLIKGNSSNNIVYNGKNYGKMTYSGHTAGDWRDNNNFKNSSGVNAANEKVWLTDDGQAWIWNGNTNSYEPIPGYQTRFAAK